MHVERLDWLVNVSELDLFLEHGWWHHEFAERGQIDVSMINYSCIRKFRMLSMIEIRAAILIVQSELYEINPSVLLDKEELLFLVEHPFEV